LMYPQNLATQVDLNSTGKPTNIRGYVTKFNDIISKKLNFSFTYLPLKLLLVENFPTISYFERDISQPFHLKYEVRSFFRLPENPANKIATVTKGYTKSDLIVLISRFKPYSMWMKAILPFESAVWWWIIGSLLVLALISGCVLMFASKAVKKFVFGSKVNTPVTNMV
jgi:hypothetical protein